MAEVDRPRGGGRYERPGLREVRGYVPGEQPTDPSVIKLNTNENPWPPSPRVAERLRSFPVERLRRYPEPLSDSFRRVAAELHGVEPGNVIATNGGDELLRLALATYVEPGETIGLAEPAYSLYRVLARLHGARVASVPLESDWSLPPDLARRWNDAGVRLAFVVNPHAPSGALYPVEALAALADALDGVLLVDEAYVDFVDPARGHDATPLVRTRDNVLLLRTLSKGYSLAGLRFGYGLGGGDLLAPMLCKTKDSYNKDALGQALASAALQDQAWARDTWERVRSERERVRVALAERDLASPPSETNFLLLHVPARRYPPGAGALQAALRERGVLVRHFGEPRLAECLRISIGTPEENDRLLALLGELVP